jgi:hypothetical protein
MISRGKMLAGFASAKSLLLSNAAKRMDGATLVAIAIASNADVNSRKSQIGASQGDRLSLSLYRC